MLLFQLKQLLRQHLIVDILFLSVFIAKAWLGLIRMYRSKQKLEQVECYRGRISNKWTTGSFHTNVIKRGGIQWFNEFRYCRIFQSRFWDTVACINSFTSFEEFGKNVWRRDLNSANKCVATRLESLLMTQWFWYLFWTNNLIYGARQFFLWRALESLLTSTPSSLCHNDFGTQSFRVS